MENRKILILTKLFPYVYAIIAGATLRLIPHPANMAPVGALALFSGSNLKGISAYSLPLAIMVVSDLFLGFHPTVPYVYISFVLIAAVGRLIRKKNLINIAVLGFFSSCLFYLITNFGVWAATSLYPKTFAGLIQSYVFGLPFFRNTIVGDFIYLIVVFGGHYVFSLASASTSRKAAA